MKYRWSGGKIQRVHLVVGLCISAILVFGIARLSGTLFDGRAAAEVKVIGANSYLQLGGENKTLKQKNLSPLALTEQTASLNIASVKAGHYHTLLLTTGGEVYALGNNALHTVSPDNKPLIGTPTKVSFPDVKAGEVITAIDSSRDHNIALTSAGRVYTWGSNYTGQLGDDTNTDRAAPTHVRNLPKIVQVTTGYRHSAVISEFGEVYAWGGVCTTENASKAQQLIDQATSNIAALGGYGSVNQTDLRSNDVGDCATLGSTFVQSKTPKKLVGMQGKATYISVGYGHLLALDETGKLYSAGCNTFGQLGRVKATDDTKNNLAVVALSGKAKALAAGYRHSAVVLEDSTAWQWGYNGHGVSLQVGVEDQKIAEPARVKTQHKFVSIEAAHDTTFGVTTLGDILGWGQDDAEAFWPLSTVNQIKTLGTATNKTVTLSGGMQHAVVAIKR